MSEKEKELLQKLSLTVPKLDEGNKKYLLGVADGMALMNEQEGEKRNARVDDNSGSTITG